MSRRGKRQQPVPIARPPKVHAFSAWSEVDVPKQPGAYAIWKGRLLVYVGMAGKNWKQDKPGHGHLERRLSDHARATRADVFPTLVFERFVGRGLADEDWAEIEAGQTHMSDHARAFIRQELSFSYATTMDPAQAREWETRLRRGELGQKPLINPLDD
jgi:hypothetical protein